MPPRSEPHPRALFSLVPCNDGATQVVNHQENQHLLSYVGRGVVGLNVGGARPSSGDGSVLATLGRNGDILVQGVSIPKIQCSFEMDPTTNAVMFYDRSHSQTSAVLGPDAYPFQHGRPRKVAVANGFNSWIGMGGVARDKVVFRLEWHGSPGGRRGLPIQLQGPALEPNPRFARTIQDHDTALQSQHGTGTHTPARDARYFRGARIGAGAFGQVHSGINVDSGQLVAIKVVHRAAGQSDVAWAELQREAVLLRSLHHPHIIEYVDSRGRETATLELFMALEDGSLDKLVLGKCDVPIMALSETVLRQMLQAIDFLATKDIVHRDIKPENILYNSRQSQYHFCLGDFGLSTEQEFATSPAGTPMYMAPEILQPRGRHTHQADVWSLFVTILWMLDKRGFRQVCLNPNADIRREVLTRVSELSQIEEMARQHPRQRASAAQMLVKCFNGEGLSTPRSRVPALTAPATTHTRFATVSSLSRHKLATKSFWPPAGLVQDRINTFRLR